MMDAAGRPTPLVSGTRAVTVACLVVAAVAATSWVLNLRLLFLRVPPAWPDESLFAAPAADLLARARMGTGLMDGLLPGIGERTYWMPPVYFVALSWFLGLAGLSLESVRAFSLLASLVVMGLVLQLGSRSAPRAWVGVFAVSVLALSHPFVAASYVGRMEMLTLLFLLACAALASRALEQQSSIGIVLAGLCSGLAAMTHPFGVVGPAALVVATLVHPQARRKPRAWTSIAAGISLPILGWAVYILGDPQSFAAQLRVQVARKAATLDAGFWDRWCYNLSQASGTSWPVGFALVAASLLGLFTLQRQRPSLAVLFWLQLATLAMLLSTREMWYPVYLLPLGAVGWAVLVRWWSGAPRLPRAARVAGVVAWLALTLVMVWGGQRALADARAFVLAHPERRASYERYAREISDSLPPGKRVLLAAIPDPTLYLMQRQDLELRHFSPVPVARAEYRAYIAQADYIVIAGESDGRIIDTARQKGTLARSVAVPEDEDYRAEVYRMR